MFHRLLAQGFGSGLFPKAPGTVGSLWAWLVFQPLEALARLMGLSPVSVAAFLLAMALIGVWACGRTADELGRQDPGSIVWDEVVAVWLVLSMLPTSGGLPGGEVPFFGAALDAFWLEALAVGLFRVFDILKPPPIRQLDQSLHGGLGIMLDDLVAALMALFTLALILRVGA